MQPEDIDKLFRDQFQHHAPPPPDYLWNQLEAELQPAKKRPVLWLYAAAAVVALLLVAGTGWLLRGPGTTTIATTTAPLPGKRKLEKQPASQATAASRAASKQTEASSRVLTATASTVQKPAPAVHAARPLTPAPALRRAVARTTPPARPTAPKSLRMSTAPVQAVAVVKPAAAPPERPASAPTTTPAPEHPTASALLATAVPTGPILVEVRRENPTLGANAYAAGGETGRRGRLGSLLLKAGKKVGSAVLDGRQINLPKVALPEIITAQVEAYATEPHP